MNIKAKLIETRIGEIEEMSSLSIKQAEEKRLVRNELYHSGTSFPEQFLYRSLLQIFPEAKNRFIDPTINMEYDIYIKELNLYIEYNGAEFHSSQEKQERDRIKRLHSEKINRTFIQIVENNEIDALDIKREIQNKFIEYKIKGSNTINNMTNNLIAIIEEIFSIYMMQGYEIDYTRSLYEAFLISSKYQYRIVYDSFGDISGKENLTQVFCEYEENNNLETEHKERKLVIKRVVDTQKKDKMIQSELDKLSAIMFTGNSLKDAGLKEVINIQEKQREVESKLSQLEIREKALEKREQELIQQEHDIQEQKMIVCEKKEIVEKRQQELNKLIEENWQREFNIRAIIGEEQKDREEQLQREKEKLQSERENYKKHLDSKYRKRLKQLNAEYDDRHRLLDSYCDKRINEEVEQRTADIERVTREQVELLKEQLSQQKIESARQQLQAKLGL